MEVTTHPCPECGTTCTVNGIGQYSPVDILESIKKDADIVHRTMSLLSHDANVSQQSLEHAEEFFKKLKTL